MHHLRQVAAEPQNACLALILLGMVVLIASLVQLVV